MADTINDVMYAALKEAGFDDQLTAMLMLWRDSIPLNGWQAYVDHVFANTTAENFADAEYEFWLHYSGEEPPSFSPLDLSPALWVDPSDAATVTISGSSGAYIGPNGLVCPGAANYALSPRIAAYDITDDIDIRARVTATDWRPAAIQILVDSRQSGGNPGWSLWIEPSGALTFAIGAVGSYSSTLATGITDGTAKWVRVTRQRSNGEIKFFLSDDGTSWTQLGATVAGPTTALTIGTFGLQVGSNGGAFSFIGTVHRAIVYSSINETNKVYDADFESATPYVSAVTESALGAPVYVISSTATSATASYSYIGPEGLVMPAGGGYLQSSSIAGVTDDIDIIAKVTVVGGDWNMGVIRTIAAHDAQNSTFGWNFQIDGNGTLRINVPGVANYNSTVKPANGTQWVRVTRNKTTGDVIFYTSSDGSSWTQLGSTVTGFTAAFAYSTPLVRIGNTGVSSFQFFGTIHRVIIKNGIGGTAIFDADLAAVPDYAASFVESSASAATVTMTAPTNTPSNAAGALVSQIDDKSGNARHLTQGTAANMPKYWNGRNGFNCLVFDGTSDKIANASTFTLAQPLMIATAVVTPSNTGVQSNFINASDAQPGIYRSAANGWAMWAGNLFTPAATDTNRLATLVADFNGAASTIRRDGATLGTGNAGAVGFSADTVTVGNNGGASQYIAATVCDVVIAASPTTTLRDSLEAYLKTKWGTP